MTDIWCSIIMVNKSLYSFFPVGGLAFEHKHALLKQPLSDNTVATYDLFDYVPGASGTGSTKWGYENDQYYMASGSQGAGTYELITYIPPLYSKSLIILVKLVVELNLLVQHQLLNIVHRIHIQSLVIIL